MCRIAGIISQDVGKDASLGFVKAMCDSMKHGGPDDEGVYYEDAHGVCLGNRRLSILDLSSKGHQPMSTASARCTITYNGEIYNFRELRSELEALGYVFHTESDTEVILNAYIAWGVIAFERLNGIFAFCLLDRADHQIYLVRDYVGIKPMYYYHTGTELIFSSEIKAFEHAGRSFAENHDWKIYLLAFGHIPEPYTTLKGVQSLPKGTYLKYDLHTKQSTVTQYQSFTYTSSITSYHTAEELVNSVFTQAVTRQLISDAPIGVFLSGGIDSSIITMLADREVPKMVNSLSVNFIETDFTEKKYQEMVAGGLSGGHTEYLIDYREFVHNFDEIIQSLDQPSNDGINSWFISKCAKENGLKAVLSGLGADELFGGYPSFDRINKIKYLKKIPVTFLKKAEYLPIVQYRRLYYLSYRSEVGEYLFLRGFLTPGVISKLLDISPSEINYCLQNIPMNHSAPHEYNGNKSSWLELNFYMQNQLLRDSDYMGMRHGVEIRMPFLDIELMRTVLGISPDIKYQHRQKQLLADAFKNLVPEEIRQREKMGFTFPFQEWMKKYKRISDPGLYANPTAKQLIKDFHIDRSHWSTAFALYQITNAN